MRIPFTDIRITTGARIAADMERITELSERRAFHLAQRRLSDIDALRAAVEAYLGLKGVRDVPENSRLIVSMQRAIGAFFDKAGSAP